MIIWCQDYQKIKQVEKVRINLRRSIAPLSKFKSLEQLLFHTWCSYHICMITMIWTLWYDHIDMITLIWSNWYVHIDLITSIWSDWYDHIDMITSNLYLLGGSVSINLSWRSTLMESTTIMHIDVLFCAASKGVNN